ncbi:DUF3857 and transglutaminase domain-containing protein [Candidatus Ozemobacteraceae bacterium]|nr:DUF3857 and transglutaminase domain-containing protein [Candidatus Ozemobacteraceae bacterium]
MKSRRSRILSLLATAAFGLFAAAIPLPAAQLTLLNGETVDADELLLESATFSLRIGSETVHHARETVRDISFSARKREETALATEAADLLPLLNRGRECLAKYPDAPSVTVLDELDYRLRPDGTNRTFVRQVLLLAKEESLGAAEVGIGFDPNRERVRLIHARCLTPDGSVHSVSPDQIKVTKASSGGEYYNPYQTMSFTIPEAEVGCMIDYAYETEEYNPFDRKLFEGRSFFQDSNPVVESLLTVRVPKGTPLYHVAPQCPPDKAQPAVRDEDGETVHRWHFTDMPPVISEPMMPPWREIVPNVAFSIQKDRTYLWDRLTPMFEKRFIVTDIVKAQVEKLTKGATDIHDKIARLYRFCQQDIRYISIKGSLAANQVGRAAEETLKNRFGDCTDKGMLLATMLKCLGIEAYPVGVRTNDAGKAIREIGIFDDNHCITEVHLASEVFYLDSTASDYRYPALRSDDHDVSVDNAQLRRINHVPLPPPEGNSTLTTRTLTLSPDGSLRIESATIATGTGEASLRGWIRSLKPEEFERHTRGSIGAISPNYTLEVATHSHPLDFSRPFMLGSTYTLHRFAPRSGSYMIFEVPGLRLRFPEVGLASRTYDISYGTTSLRADEITVKLPAGFTVKYLPAPVSVETPWVRFSSKYTQTGDTIVLSRRTAVTARRVPVAEYHRLKQALEKISQSTEERIFLEETAVKETGR